MLRLLRRAIRLAHLLYHVMRSDDDHPMDSVQPRMLTIRAGRESDFVALCGDGDSAGAAGPGPLAGFFVREPLRLEFLVEDPVEGFVCSFLDDGAAQVFGYGAES